jgi:hypothetical protein
MESWRVEEAIDLRSVAGCVLATCARGRPRSCSLFLFLTRVFTLALTWFTLLLRRSSGHLATPAEDTFVNGNLNTKNRDEIYESIHKFHPYCALKNPLQLSLNLCYLVQIHRQPK